MSISTRLIIPLLSVLACLFAAHPAQAHPVLNFIGSYKLGKGMDMCFDAATGSPDPRELQRQLRYLEQSLRSMGNEQEDLLRELQAFYKKVDERTSREAVEKIVRTVLEGYEQRLANLEGRMDRADQRIKDFENLFGYVSVVLPTPLVLDSASGEAVVHPMTAEWARWLVRSETNRLALAQARLTFNDNAPEVTNLLGEARTLLASIEQLHTGVKAELAARLPEREALLETRRPGHPAVVELDSRLASLAWLVGVTKPIAKGPDQGRLPIPVSFLGPQCSEVLLAFQQSGVAEAELIPLFRLLLTMPIENPAADREPLPASLLPLVKRSETFNKNLMALQDQALQVKQSLASALGTYSPAHPTVVGLREQKAALIAQTARLHQEGHVLLHGALRAYIRELQVIRPTNVAMVAFRQRILQTLEQALQQTEGATNEMASLREQVWEELAKQGAVNGVERAKQVEQQAYQAFLKQTYTNSLGMKFIPVAGTRIFFCAHETRVKDYAAYAAANRGVDDSWKDAEYSGHKQTPEHPVVYVSRDDAKAFCEWLSAKEGKQYRLPTDHEWSVAVGIGDREDPSQTPQEKSGRLDDVYPWGPNWPPPKEAGNFNLNSDEFPFTAPVGSFTLNHNGIYDLSGNVWEWCEDKYSRSSSAFVLRGGSWSDSYRLRLLSSRRGSYDSAYRYNSNGFRCGLAGAVAGGEAR